MEALQKKPLKIKSYQGDFQVPVSAVASLDGLESPDLILIAVKCYDTDLILKQIQPLVSSHTTLLSLQNGVENEIKMSTTFSPQQTIGGVCYIGSETLEPGLILHNANGSIAIGELDGAITPRIQSLTEMFQKAQIDVRPSDNIWKNLWIKLGWNASFNQVCTIARTDVGHVLDDPHLLELIKKTYREVFAMARGHQVDIDDSVIEASLMFSQKDLRSVRPSMLQDFENHRQLEHETFSGFLSREGKRLNIPTPINDTFYEFLSFLNPKKSS
ncbi:MAG: ketopantoate reductase family protein [Deltaproteobacteria bacterium]|nr:MAG: ketopantoate reductase family protein [Deltaproteobacteria bacterium]